jgi:hypothetical protein
LGELRLRLPLKPMTTYKIVRAFFNSEHRSKVIVRGLTLDEAQAWCNNPETSSMTCKSVKSAKLTERYGAWFDGYEAEQ